MSESLRWMRPLAGTAAILLLGLSGQAHATYGGGACHRCSPAPVVATSYAYNVVALQPQVQTVMQTVFETVYENEPVTVMETRYRQGYRTENYTVMRPVTETSQVARNYTVMKPVYQTTNYQKKYTVMKPVYQTERRERRYSVMKPVYQTVNQQRKYTVMKPVVETQRLERRYTVSKPVYQTVNQERRYTVMKPVMQTQRLERRYTVMKPVYQTVNQQRKYTVMKPVVQTTMVSEPYTVCRPVTTTRQVVEECGYYETQKTIVPGPVYERQVKVPVGRLRVSAPRPLRLQAQEEGLGDRRRSVPAARGLPDGLSAEAGRPRRLRDPVCLRDDDPSSPRSDVLVRRRGAGRKLPGHHLPDGRRGAG